MGVALGKLLPLPDLSPHVYHDTLSCGTFRTTRETRVNLPLQGGCGVTVGGHRAGWSEHPLSVGPPRCSQCVAGRGAGSAGASGSPSASLLW